MLHRRVYCCRKNVLKRHSAILVASQERQFRWSSYLWNEGGRFIQLTAGNPHRCTSHQLLCVQLRSAKTIQSEALLSLTWWRVQSVCNFLATWNHFEDKIKEELTVVFLYHGCFLESRQVTIRGTQIRNQRTSLLFLWRWFLQCNLLLKNRALSMF